MATAASPDVTAPQVRHSPASALPAAHRQQSAKGKEVAAEPQSAQPAEGHGHAENKKSRPVGDESSPNDLGNASTSDNAATPHPLPPNPHHRPRTAQGRPLRLHHRLPLCGLRTQYPPLLKRTAPLGKIRARWRASRRARIRSRVRPARTRPSLSPTASTRQLRRANRSRTLLAPVDRRVCSPSSFGCSYRALVRHRAHTR